MVALLAAHRADVDVKVGTGQRVLHACACEALPAAVGALLEHTATVDARDDGGRTPLQ